MTDDEFTDRLLAHLDIDEPMLMRTMAGVVNKLIGDTARTNLGQRIRDITDDEIRKIARDKITGNMGAMALMDNQIDQMTTSQLTRPGVTL